MSNLNLHVYVASYFTYSYNFTQIRNITVKLIVVPILIHCFNVAITLQETHTELHNWHIASWYKKWHNYITGVLSCIGSLYTKKLEFSIGDICMYPGTS